jgi:hypothetical protein
LCKKAGARITATDEVLLRQVNPKWMEDGEPSSQSFYPWRDIDECCMSVDRGSMTSAADAFDLFTKPMPAGFAQASIGVWGITVAEVDASDLSVWDDPIVSGRGEAGEPRSRRC